MFIADLIYASNEPKSVLARDLGDCRDNLRNSRSVFLIVGTVRGGSCLMQKAILLVRVSFEGFLEKFCEKMINN